MQQTAPGIEYETVSSLTYTLAKGLMKVWEKLGRPDDITSATGMLVVDNIVQVWMKYYPEEVSEWCDRLKNELKLERTVHQAVKQEGGYFPVSYPERLYHMLHTMFPKAKLGDKKFFRAFINRYPLFKSTNYAV